MQLRTRFILLIGLVISCSYGVTFYRTSGFQEELVVQQATRQARMLFHQIRLTRQWVADHNGLFFVKGPGVEKNPYLAEGGEIRDEQGNWLVKRNPAMVTRELSVYAAREGMGQFNVTSLQPVNPANAPDDFERRSLKEFEGGREEAVVAIERVEGTYRLRYMAPLKVEPQCLQCHAKQGYKVGDIRGGMNVTIPMDQAYAEIGINNRMLLNIAVATIVIVSLAIFFLFDILVARRLKTLAREMDRYPQRRRDDELPADEDDEIGALAGHYRKLCQRLELSQQELDATREQVFRSEKQAALGRLVAGISHEINNPLGGMQNCIQMMKRSLDQPALLVRYLNLLGQGVDRIKGTVQQLLNIGRREPLELCRGDVDTMLRDCLELTCVGRRNVRIDLQAGVGKPLLVGLEALRQVVLNLAGNAVQAMGEEGGTLRATSRLEGGWLTIEIADSGPGIDPQHMDKIFEPFFTTKEVGEGTGLGLSVSHSLVKRMGGELTARNGDERGAVFTVSVPLPEENGNAPEMP